jgi:hypothetical protein
MKTLLVLLIIIVLIIVLINNNYREKFSNEHNPNMFKLYELVLDTYRDTELNNLEISKFIEYLKCKLNVN